MTLEYLSDHNQMTYFPLIEHLFQGLQNDWAHLFSAHYSVYLWHYICMYLRMCMFVKGVFVCACVCVKGIYVKLYEIHYNKHHAVSNSFCDLFWYHKEPPVFRHAGTLLFRINSCFCFRLGVKQQTWSYILPFESHVIMF